MAPAFSRILLAYDESDGSRMALRYACGLAEPGATLTVMHAVKESNFIASAAMAGSFPAIDPKPMIDAVDDWGDSVVRTAVHDCAALGVAAEKVFAHGAPGDAVVEAGRQVRADIIVVGTHARKGIARAVRGSVAESIVRASDVPVLVVTGHVKAPRTNPIFQRALVAVDEWDASTAVLLVAARLSAGLGTRLTFCNVDDSSGRKLNGNGAERGEPDLPAAVAFFLKRAMAAKDIAPSLDDEIIVEGERAGTIEHAAAQRNCDVIVVGSHGRRGFQRLWDGSVAIARSSALPVLVVPVQQDASRVEAVGVRLREKAQSR